MNRRSFLKKTLVITFLTFLSLKSFSSLGTAIDKQNSQKNSPKKNNGWILLDDDTKSE
tara:strand:+ start:389 stop:562 length:174 start_codon:yes stop_codon:yes gene_type:complete